MLRTALLCAVSAVVLLSGDRAQSEEPARKARVLMLTESAGFRHGSVTRKDNRLAPAEIAMIQLGQKTGLFEVHCTQDSAADFTRENLQNYDIVMFYTTGDLPIRPADFAWFRETWLKQHGRGFIGFHSATDTYREFAPYYELINGTFDGHPWNARMTVAVSVHDQDHPAAKPFGESFRITDEIYQYRNFDPAAVRVLMSLDMTGCDVKKPYHVPVAWVRDWGDGRIFYTNLGHNETTWTNPQFLASVEGAVRWILHLEEGDATPNPEVSAREDRKAAAAAGE